MKIIKAIAAELDINPSQVSAAVKLLDEGATVPFIARYRKEATNGLNDEQLRTLVERLQYLRELDERRETILKSIEDQDKLTPELKRLILEAENKTRLEDLYLPYKPKRRTKAQIAREAGLEPLALSLLEDPAQNPQEVAENYLNEDVTDSHAALEGARHILMEHFSENAELLANLRQFVFNHGLIESCVAKGKEEVGLKFKDYYEFSELLKKIPSHRALALFRGRKQDILQLSLGFSEESQLEHCYALIAKQFNIQDQQRQADAWLQQTVQWTWKIKLQIKLQLELFSDLKDRAESEAINVFKDNLKHLLMTAPAGNRVVLGLDPGIRTGVKVAVVSGVGKLLDYTAIYPHPPKNQKIESIETLAKLCKQYHVDLISIGNGTASRETDVLVKELMETHSQLQLTKIMVSEAGASVYSASKLAAEEFPELDVSIRGAVSIARRLQDPLAELVKIDPKSIGVGQYQHDVNQVKLGRSLEAVKEDCVNAVGADVNTASVPLLTSVAGLNETIARNIVTYREQQGRFENRKTLKKVPRLGEKTYEQAIGFLRIIDGDNPLDASAVHPESYPVVDQMIRSLNKPIAQVMGNTALVDMIRAKDFVNDQFGLATVQDILLELKKPGRDPRPDFKAVKFQEGIEKPEDLKSGMKLEGVVTNVANFGAFVDIGVHQDGLVHISQVSNHYVKDIHKVVKVGDIVQVKVIDVDLKRQRIGLTMKF